jgi:hypothetical protein
MMAMMAMGMVSNLATYQRLMDQMLDGIEEARAYIDDILVATTDCDRQLHALQLVLDKVHDHKLLLQPSKYSCCVQRVVCLEPACTGCQWLQACGARWRLLSLCLCLIVP